MLWIVYKLIDYEGVYFLFMPNVERFKKVPAYYNIAH